MNTAGLYSIFEGVAIAISALVSNKVRAALTIVGVAIGVFVVVIISATVHGINASVTADMQAAGPSTFYLSRWPLGFNTCDGSDDACPWRNWPSITSAEMTDISRLPSILAVDGTINGSGAVSYRGQTLSSPSISGELPAWTEVSGTDIIEGRNFTPDENSAAANVAVINQQMASYLLGNLEPVGKAITVGGQPYMVIGLMREATSFLSGADRPKMVVPYETSFRHLNADPTRVFVTIKPRASYSQDDAIDDVISALRADRGLKPRTDNNFAITTNQKVMDTFNKTVGMFFLVMISLSAIGLLVGGVGVVAIMMISVTERTREIGIRKALGATRRTILWQFLVEAATLTSIGAIVGLVFGWAGTLLLNSLTPLNASIPPLAILSALGGSALTGILFGMLPALRASRLDPVEALRYE